MVHRFELAAVHRPSATVAQHDCRYDTARGETWQASVLGRNAGRQPERPEDVVFEETSLVSTLSQGLEAPGFRAQGFRSSGFGFWSSRLRVCDSEWMTDGCRETLIERSNVQDFGDTGGVSAGMFKRAGKLGQENEQAIQVPVPPP
jgi:hypothetical protein